MKKIIMIAGLMILTAPIFSWAGQPEAVVSNVIGESTVARGRKSVPVTEGMKIKKKDVIKTGAQGIVDVSFNGQAGIRLLPLTEASVEGTNQDKSRVSIASGNILVRFIPDKDKKKKDRFQVETPVVIAGVRGTQFWGRVDKDNFDLNTFAVREGIVRIKDKSTGKTFTLKEKDAVEFGPKVADPKIRGAMESELFAMKDAENIKILSAK